jgi:GTP pyrophosphokinase
LQYKKKVKILATKEKLLSKLEESLTEYSKEEVEKIIKAYEFAELKHQGQKRASGEEFITHPLSVAIILAGMNVDYEMIITGLLHDVVEDTESSMQEIARNFGKNIANMVDGVTKISKLKPFAYNEIQAESIRKMLVAMTNDIKVIIVKFADKIHNLNTLNFLSTEKRKKIANETLEIYAPLAGKLGVHYLKDRLEDLALRWVNPEVYSTIKGHFDKTEKDRERTKKLISRKLHEKLEEIKIPFLIKSRAKHYYSIFNKMKKYTLKISELFDLYGIRIITDSVQNCYQIFGAVHNLWQPIPGRFKDYIANPKKNGYRSLHTAVQVEKRKVVEIQIRTQEMDEFNEYGVAAHWYYKTGERPNTEELKWLKRLVKLHKQVLSPEEYYQIIRDDILKDEIYVFTPKGDSFELPKGATAIDFAYHIHTEVGHRCVGAKANGSIIQLNKPLRNGVVVDIITSKVSNPKQDWLSFVKTANARKKIKSWLASNKKINLKKESEEKKETTKKSKKSPKATTKANINETRYSVEVEGEKNLLYKFAKCCNPLPNDPIVGFVSRGRGIIIHKKDCYNLNYIKDIKKRAVSVNWSFNKKS